jgi:photosystem II stability/assembly factor-like uncharacterized protein
MKNMKSLTVLLAFLFLYISNAFTQPLDVDKFENMKARSIGPAGMSGRVTAIEAVVSNPKIIYVGTASGGVWKSMSGGTQWKPVFDDQDVINIGAMAITQNNPDVIWVGTGEGNPRNSLNLGEGIYKSLDGGKTWKLMGLGKTRNIHRIIIDPRNENIVYTGAIGNPWADSDRGVFKTTDGGKTWKRILYVDEKTGVADLVIDPANPNKLIAAMWEHRRKPWTFTSGGPGSGIFVTHDGGENWTKRTSDEGLPEGDLGRIGLAIAASNPNIVYALVEAKKNALYKSSDGGVKWEMINDKDEIGNRPFYYYDIYVDPMNENRLYTIYSRVGLSEDGGKSFRTIVRGIHSDHHAWWIHPEEPTYIIDGNDGGMAISRDHGETWYFIENLPVAQFYHIRVDNDLPYNVYGGLQDNGSWKGPGYMWSYGGIRNEYWQPVLGGDGFDVVPDPDDSRYGYAMSQGGYLTRFDTETGFTYSIKPTEPDLETKLRFNWNAALEQDPFDNSTIYYGSQFVHKSTDKGLTWEIISPDLTTNDPEKQKQDESGGLTLDVTGAENHTTIISLAVNPVEKGIIWAGTDDGNVQVTRDGGKTWINVASGLPGLPPGSWIPQIRASSYTAGEAWVVANNYRRGDFKPYAYYTSNFGNTWKGLLDENKVKGYALSIIQDPVEPKLVFLGTEHGLWVSIDKGITWVQWKHGFPPVSTMDLAIQEREADLVIGTFGRSIYVLDDIRPLREIASMGAGFDNIQFTAFDPPDGYITGYKRPPGVYSGGDAMFDGENRTGGGRLRYYLKPEEEKENGAENVISGKKKGPGSSSEEPGDMKGSDYKVKYDTVTVEIYDKKGEKIRTLKAKAESGVNPIVWAFYKKGIRYPGRYAFSGQRGRSPSDQEPRGFIALPGTYKVVMTCGDIKDSTSITTAYSPLMPVDLEGLKKQEVMFEKLNKKADLVNKALERLNDSKRLTEKVMAQVKDRDEDEIKELKKETKAIQDSIKALNEFIYGESSEKQGISDRSQLNVSSKLSQARSYIMSRLTGPTTTEERLLKECDIMVKVALEKVNTFYASQWPGYRDKVENTELIIFKDYKPLMLE